MEINYLPTFLITLSSILFTASAVTSQTIAEAEKWLLARNISQPDLHFTIYVHDAIGGPAGTVWDVAQANITSASNTSVGLVRVLDDVITKKPKRGSKELGRLQGMYAFVDSEEQAISMNVNIVFQAESLNGSTLHVSGRIPVFSRNRELVVTGGTGLFRMLGGYVLSTTLSLDPIKNYAIIKYAVFLYKNGC